ncbi:MAG: SurA N-terminal domain-containing protein [Deltaproteobacteria bacterium]
MKRQTVVFLLGILALGAGCDRRPAPDVLARVNNYTITRAEFEREFQDSRYARPKAANGKADIPQARREFLDNLVNRKLMLQDAQARGMDKDPAFLRSVEKFWEQSLLKVYLETEADAVAGIKVDEAAVRKAYDEMPAEARADRSFEQLAPQIRWQLTRVRQADALNAWIAGLRRGARIQIDEASLNAPR